MNTFIENMKKDQNYTRTENGALAHKSTLSGVYDLFALGGAYRTRSDADVITLFQKALDEDETYALKCLFYLRDVRGGQGERRFFRIAYRWMCEHRLETAFRNIELIPEYGRYDDWIYIAEGTPAESVVFGMIAKQLKLDIGCKAPSLLAKWMPSENASSAETRRLGNKLRQFMGMNHKQYRVLLSELRKRINVLERLMSANRWDEIEFDKIPSKAGLIYKNAFARRDILKERYRAFVKDEKTKVNTKALYPYEVVEKAKAVWHYKLDETERLAVNKYWENLPDYFQGSEYSILPVIDTSGSMMGRPLDIACSLGIYAGERNHGPFHNHYISFASKPQLITIEGADFVDKVRRIYAKNLCDNTNLTAVFDLLLRMILLGEAKVEDLPKAIVIVSDQEIDEGTRSWVGWHAKQGWTKETAQTEMETIRYEWASHGIELPHLVYWNCNARHDVILDSGPDVTFVSGASPVIFEQVISGVTGQELMYKKLDSVRYAAIS